MDLTECRRRYFGHLKSLVEYISKFDSYSILLDCLNRIEFYAIHPMDQNRARDAICNRLYYTDDAQVSTGYEDDIPSVFEVLVAIAQRMNFLCAATDEDLTKDIFWHLLDNLGLSGMSDMNFHELGGEIAVQEIADRWLSRSYHASGEGGLFPMAKPKQDQRELEIFYQMNQYVRDPNGSVWIDRELRRRGGDYD